MAEQTSSPEEEQEVRDWVHSLVFGGSTPRDVIVEDTVEAFEEENLRRRI
jgi:hypothetical protein